jgi:serine/threonine protein kinase
MLSLFLKAQVIFCLFSLFWTKTVRSEAAYAYPLDQYEILTLLGAGDRAEIFLAKDVDGNFFAIKRFYTKKQLTASFNLEQLDKMFAEDGSSRVAEYEFLLSKQIQHPHILLIYDLFHQNENGEKRSYLAMEWIEGLTLRQTPSHSYNRSTAIQYALNGLQAFYYLLERGFFPDDLHPSNIMFDKTKGIKLIDLEGFNKQPQQTIKRYVRNYLAFVQALLVCGDFENEELAYLFQDLSLLGETCLGKQDHPQIEDLLLFLQHLSRWVSSLK